MSVVVPVRDGGATIADQLAALLAQTYDGEWELVIADNGSTDDTLAVVRQWASRFSHLRVVDASGRRGPAHARARGAQAASGDFLAFCDADDVVAPGWLASLVDAAADFDIVTGTLEAGVVNAEPVRAWRSERASGLPRSRFLPYAPSGNLGVWADVYERTGGFNESYLRSEDVEWSWRAQLASFTLGFAPGAVVHYRYRDSARSVARQAYLAGLSSTRLYRDFRSEGLPRVPLRRALRRWLWLLVRAPHLLSRDRRGLWVRRAGEAVGRVSGSVRFRVWCP